MRSTLFHAAALLSLGGLMVATPAHANTLSGLSNLSSYSLHDPDGLTFVDQNIGVFASVGADGSLTTTATDLAGGVVTLNFDLYSDGETFNDFSASVNGVALYSEINIAYQNFALETIQFVATGSDTISFVGHDDPGAIEIGDVFATEAPIATSVTPEPSSFVLLGTGLLGAMGSLKRRFA